MIFIDGMVSATVLRIAQNQRVRGKAGSFSSDIMFYNLMMLISGMKWGSDRLKVDSAGRVSCSMLLTCDVLLRKRA